MALVGIQRNAPRIGFVFSTEVGLKTQYQNWREALTRLAPPLDPRWIIVDWHLPGGLLERLPLLPGSWKARLRSQQQLRTGLQSGPFDGLLIGAPAITYNRRKLLSQQPYFVAIDCTPKQLYTFGDYYGKKPSAFAPYERWKEQSRREFYQNARLLFPWSHWAAESMIHDYGADPAHVEVVPPGINLDLWQTEPRALTDDIHLLFVGGDFVRKGGDLLLDWAQQTRKRNWHLHLVTRDPVPTPHPNIHVYYGLGPNHPDLIALYRKAQLFVMPTRCDCYSLASMEAMASGLPVLLSQVGGTGDIIHDGETGYLLPPGDYDALVDRLEFLLSNPQHLGPMGIAARHDAEERYDVEKNVGRILARMEQELAKAS